MHSIRSYIKAIEDIGFFESNIDCKENNVQRNIPLKQTAITISWNQNWMQLQLKICKLFFSLLFWKAVCGFCFLFLFFFFLHQCYKLNWLNIISFVTGIAKWSYHLLWECTLHTLLTVHLYNMLTKLTDDQIIFQLIFYSMTCLGKCYSTLYTFHTGTNHPNTLL